MPRILTTKIGTIVNYKGIRLQIIQEIDRCRGCYFHRMKYCTDSIMFGSCMGYLRSDNTNIIFRKIDTNRKENLHKRTKR